MNKKTSTVRTVEQWLEHVVIGLNLCPFAAHPYKQNSVKITLCDATDNDAVLHDLHDALVDIDQHPAAETETTLLVLTHHLDNFIEFNDFLSIADALLKAKNWEGVYQIASFHPDYQFAETAPDDVENLTNRAPYPILHIIREESIERVLENYPDPDRIYERNMETMNKLDQGTLKKLFPHLNI